MTADGSADRRVLLPAPYGWCAGVDRAVQTVETAIQMYGPPMGVRKQIVHNVHVVRERESRGAFFVDDADDVPDDGIPVSSAHGFAPQMRSEAEQRGLRTIDATCPLVTKVHHEARRLADKGYAILLISHEGHEEVTGTVDEAADAVPVVAGPEHADTIEVCDPTRVAWLSQTTLSVDETTPTADRLRRRFPALLDPPGNDTCYPTQNQEIAARAIATERILLVGSANSANAARLVEVALEARARNSHLTESANEIDPRWFGEATTVGLTSGASILELPIRGVPAALPDPGFVDVQPVGTVRDHICFTLSTSTATTGRPSMRGRRQAEPARPR